MKLADSEYIIVGKIGTTYGIRGWLKVLSFTEVISDILEYNPWYLEDKNDWKPIQLEEGREHGKGVVAKLHGYHTPEQARLITGKMVAVKRSQLPKLKKNEFYWKDLEGLTVVNLNDEVLGKVSYLMETGANDVLVVKHNNKEHAVPYLPDKVVKDIDLVKQIIRVDWEVI